MQEIMGQIITNVPEEASAEHRCRHKPIPVEDRVGEFVERSS